MTFFFASINGKTVLPNIHAESADLDVENKHGGHTDLERIPSGRKKKHKKSRHGKEHRGSEIIITSPLEHQTDIYKPQDRGKEKIPPNLYSADDTLEKGTPVHEDANKEKQTEQEVIKALAGLEMNELSYLSTC